MTFVIFPFSSSCFVFTFAVSLTSSSPATKQQKDFKQYIITAEDTTTSLSPFKRKRREVVRIIKRCGCCASVTKEKLQEKNIINSTTAANDSIKYTACVNTLQSGRFRSCFRVNASQQKLWFLFLFSHVQENWSVGQHSTEGVGVSSFPRSCLVDVDDDDATRGRPPTLELHFSRSVNIWQKSTV